MADQVLNKEFAAYAKLLDSSQKSFILNLMKFLFSKNVDVERISHKQYNKEIDAAVKRIAKGKFFTHEEAEKEMSKW